jgi:hypothetical protein
MGSKRRKTRRRAGTRPGTHLVTKHLENISRKALDDYQQIVREYVRRQNGIYVLYRKGKLYYVGLATDLRYRLKSHLRDRHGASWDRFSVYLTVGDSHLRELEALILRTVKPAGNKQKGKLARSENLLRRFKKDIKRSQTEQLAELLGETVRARGPARNGRRNGEPVLARYLSGPVRLRGKYKGRVLRATVLRSGKIRFQGKLYNSPSLAGAAACKRPACNGWTFWEFQRSPGGWASINELRR